MVLMYFLRALEELGLYYAFAGTVAGARGASMTMAVLLVQSGCFALSALLRNRRWARLAALLPAAVLLFFAGGPDRIMSLPGFAYLVCLAWLVARSIVPKNGVSVILPKRHGSQASNDS